MAAAGRAPKGGTYTLHLLPLPVLGAGIAVLALILVAAGLWLVLHRPFVGLGVLVAGMALHNFLIMGLLALHTPPLLIRVVQGWKEVVLALLTVLAARILVRAYQNGERPRLLPMDWIAMAFAAMLVIYLLLPSRILGDASLLQRLAAFRTAGLLPLLYFLGRVFSQPCDRDLTATSWLIVGAGALVGVFGLYELWFVPTITWLDWGVNLFSAWLGYDYKGPAGMPANFFQTLPDGLLLRRMVSTYVSPLGIAYTGLLAIPIGVVLMFQRGVSRNKALLAGLALALLLTGVLLSVTRFALASLGGEVVLLGLILRSGRVWILAAVVIGLIALTLFGYPYVGPVVDPYLLASISHRPFILGAGDPSLAEHLRALAADIKVASHHLLGVGLGGSVRRFVPAGAESPAGESAVLGFFGDIGVVGGFLYMALYGLGLYSGWRALRNAASMSLASALPLVAFAGGVALIPITLTSDVWGDFSVTFLFWWAAGYSAALAGRRSAAAPDSARAEPGRAA